MLRNWLSPSLAAKTSPASLIQEFESIRTKSEIVAITCQPSGNDWRGVYNGCVGMFGPAAVGLVHQYSNNVYSQKELKAVAAALRQLSFRRIVFSGYAPALRALMDALHQQDPAYCAAHCLLIYHGSLSQHGEDYRHIRYLADVIDCYHRGLVGAVGFMKKGLFDTLHKLHGIRGAPLLTIVDVRSLAVQPKPGLHIGVFTHQAFRKNLHNQVAAALLFDQATVHVHDDKDLDYLNGHQRIQANPFLESYDAFLQLLGSMTVNFYCSFSECFGMVIAESLALGVPCVASNSSGIFDYDPELGHWLTPNDIDNPLSIFAKAQQVLQHRDSLALRGRQYILELNAQARKMLDAFLELP